MTRLPQSRMGVYLKLMAALMLISVIGGCGTDRQNPTPTTEGDRLMESYLAKVQSIGEELADVNNEAEARSASTRVMLIVSDMRDLRDKMKSISDKEQADTMSKYRVKINKVNEKFVEDVKRFVAIPGVSEELVKDLQAMPNFDDADEAVTN